MRPCSACNGNHYRRRDFLRAGALNFLGISLPHVLAAQRAHAAGKGKAQSVILLWLDGGASHVDMWDPKAASSFKPIATNVAGIQISELFPRLARHMDKISVIRSLRTEENNHGTGHHYALTGHRPNPAMKFPSLGSIVVKELGARDGVPAYVQMPSLNAAYDEHFKAQILGGAFDPMILAGGPGVADGEVREEVKDLKVPDLSLPNSLSRERIEDRRAFLAMVDRTYRRKAEAAAFADMDELTTQAYNMILSPAVRKAFDVSEESDNTKDSYGRDGFGQSVLLARRLVEAGSRFVTACGYKTAAWDTHNFHDSKLRDKLAPPLDRALATLLGDLKERGLLDSTIVIVMSEFGRTPHHNANHGRDHWPDCWSILIGGGGINGGVAVGASDGDGALPAGRAVSIGDVFATIYKALGIDWTREYMHPVGRPLKIANGFSDATGEPIRELI